MKVYLAAPLFTDEQRTVLSALKRVLEKTGHGVFSPYHASQEIFKGRPPKECSAEERALVLQGNIKGIEESQILLAWVGGYEQGFTDPGVIWEMGYAAAISGAPAAFGKRWTRYPFTLAYIHDTDKRQQMNLMLSGTVDAVVVGLVNFSKVAPFFKSPATLRALAEKYNPRLALGEEMEPVV